MADRSALGKLGWTFGAVTAAVMLIAAVVVQGSFDGRPGVAGKPVAAASLSASLR